MSSIFPINQISVVIAGLSIGLFCLINPDTVQASQSDVLKSEERKMTSDYETAMARGDETTAIRYVLEYTEKTYGENAPETVKLTYRYGSILYKEGNYQRATEVLIKALERSTAVYGDSGGKAFEINMNIAYAVSQWRTGLLPRMKYFNRALEILRERGEHESITYVTTLVSIVINMMDHGGLSGNYTSHLSDSLYSEAASEMDFPIESEYTNNFDRAEKYIREAVELGKKLEIQDEYISSKIAIAHAKLNVLETADLGAVPMGVTGYISKGTERDYYDREAERLEQAIDKLSEDTETNRIFLSAANSVLMDIAWMDENEDRMLAMCASGSLNSAADYSPDRLYEVMEGGKVFAPNMGVRISTNIFKPLRSRGRQKKDENGNPVKKPYFVPVCIDGQLMAALVNAPRVTIEEIR
jgi:tetratricopeptide (TPR) repeat protein